MNTSRSYHFCKILKQPVNRLAIARTHVYGLVQSVAEGLKAERTKAPLYKGRLTALFSTFYAFRFDHIMRA